jgi:hypothetical protein
MDCSQEDQTHLGLILSGVFSAQVFYRETPPSAFQKWKIEGGVPLGNMSESYYF